MTKYLPLFSPPEFENRGYTNPYLTENQQEAVNLAEGRVNDQLNWVAQQLGWNGPNYWGNLATTVAQKRRILGGTFGVYNRFYFPLVKEIRNWDSRYTPKSANDLTLNIIESDSKLWVVTEKDPRIEIGQKLFVGEESTTVNEIYEEENNYVLPLENLSSDFISLVNSGSQLKFQSFDELPEPFNRPSVNTSSDTSFLCGTLNNELVLYPSFNSEKSLPYVLAYLIPGGTYYFDQPIYLSKSEASLVDNVPTQYPKDILPEYDINTNLWSLSIPENFSVNQLGGKAYLVWLYSNSQNQTFCVREVIIKTWSDPSDWKSERVLNGYIGSWGNKGGVLPYNFIFDSLEISGFDEEKSLLLERIETRVAFNDLLNFVYYQQTPIDVIPPGGPNENSVWWDSDTGSFSIWKSDPYGCGTWKEILYPEPPTNQETPEYVYPTVSDFAFSQQDIPDGVLIEIVDVSGLNSSNKVVGLLGTLTTPSSIKLYKRPDDFWQPTEFIYADELDFYADALNLPWNVPVYVQNAADFGILRDNYKVVNLKIIIEQSLPIQLMKYDSNEQWMIKPASRLKYIGNTRLFSDDPVLSGAMNWNFDEEDENLRRAVIFYYSRYEETSPGQWVLAGDWIDINTGEATDPPSAPLDFGAVLVYCNGELVQPNVEADFEAFSFIFSVDSESGEFVFKYDPITFDGVVNLPKITITDSLTSAFTHDISEYVFSGARYFMTPNVLDCEVPLRLWKTEALQVQGEEEYEKSENYVNGLVADENNGPQEDNWSRYFLRLPPRYGRNDSIWQKVALVCQNFGYWGSPVSVSQTECLSEARKPRIYEQVYLYREEPSSPSILYIEPYLYSDIAFGESAGLEDFSNSSVLPTFDTPYDEFSEGEISSYEPLHNRRVNTDLPVGQGYGDWEGIYVRADACAEISGFESRDLITEVLEAVEPPLWDASIYKLPHSCEVNDDSYAVDTNNFKLNYAYFTADLSCSEDGFFDFWKEASLRQGRNRIKTFYMTN